jgi:transposase
MSSGASFKICQTMGYDQSQRSLNRHVAAVAAGGQVFNRIENAGRKKKLNMDQKEDIRDWLTTRNDKHVTTSRRQLAKHIQDTWDITLTTMSIGNLMREEKYSTFKTSKVTGKSNVPFSTKQKSYWDFILGLRAKNTLSIPAKSVHSIDVTYTRDASKHTTTIAPKESPKQKDGRKKYKYSDAIITCISPVNGNPTPCVMHTYNPQMAPQATSNGPVAKAKRTRFVELLEQYRIDESRIVYTKSSKNFRGEDYGMFKDYLTRFAFPKTDVFLHDGGGAYKDKGVTVFDELGLKKHVAYPTEVHQWLSPNDNNLHGVKEVWKTEFPDMNDDPEAPLRLMQLIDQDALAHARYYFERNILRVTKSQVRRVMKG